MAFISLPRNDDRNIMATGANGIMEIDDRARNGSDRRIALLIDADNVPHSKIADMLAELSKYGTANIRRAYGDWASAGLKNWKDKLHDFAIRIGLLHDPGDLRKRHVFGRRQIALTDRFWVFERCHVHVCNVPHIDQ